MKNSNGNNIDRLRQILITSGVDVTEAAIEMETSSALSPWAWYAGAHQQYHYALLLCMEIFAFPMRKEADRIWACLDYVFEVPSHLSRDQKGRWILTEVRDRVEIFASTRKVRAPTGLVDRLGQQPLPKSDVPNDPWASLGKMQHFSNSSNKVTPDLNPGDDLYGQHVTTNKLQENSQPIYLATNNQLPEPSASDDRMVDIDWVNSSLLLV